MSSGPLQLRTLENGIPRDRDPLPFLGIALPATPFVVDSET